MLKAAAGKILPTTITGSLPRPSWYTENLGPRSFLEAMVYKMVSLVLGVNIVRKELGVPEAQSVMADPKLSLLR